MGVHVGDRGVTESPLYLTGAIRIGGVRLTARSDRGPIERGIAVIVVGDDPQGLVVRPLEPGHDTQQFPDHGRPVFTSPQERTTAAEERLEKSNQHYWAAHRRRGLIIGAALGALTAAAVLWAIWGWIAEQPESPNTVAAVALVAGAVWGCLVYRVVDAALGLVDEGYRRLGVASTSLGLVGTAAGAALAVPWAGLGGGLVVAVVATALLAAVIPLLLIFVGA